MPDRPTVPTSVDHFSDRAEMYARHRPVYPAAAARVVAGAAAARGRVWEPGCGSGQLTGALAAMFDTVVASDPSADQLARAPRQPGIHLLRERAETSALSTGSADAVVVGQAAHWVDLPAFYREATRVGRPGAVVALVSYGTPRVDGPPGTLVSDFHRRTLAPYWPPARRHVDDGYARLPFPFPRIPAPALDMERSWSVEDFLGYAGSWSGVRRAIEATGPALFDAFAGSLRTAWGTGARRVRWPLTILMGRLPGPSSGWRPEIGARAAPPDAP